MTEIESRFNYKTAWLQNWLFFVVVHACLSLEGSEQRLGFYQADEQAGVARLRWRGSGR